jgi:hypothetical protein
VEVNVALQRILQRFESWKELVFVGMKLQACNKNFNTPWKILNIEEE